MSQPCPACAWLHISILGAACRHGRSMHSAGACDEDVAYQGCKGCNKNPTGAHRSGQQQHALSVSVFVSLLASCVALVGRRKHAASCCCALTTSRRMVGSLRHGPCIIACDQSYCLCQNQAGFLPAAAACTACSAGPIAAMLPALHEHNECAACTHQVGVPRGNKWSSWQSTADMHAVYVWQRLSQLYSARAIRLTG